MRLGDPDDPLLRQVVPTVAELGEAHALSPNLQKAGRSPKAA